MELVALEYRQAQFVSVEALGARLAAVADGCAEAGLFAVGLAGLLDGRLLLEETQAAHLLFGLRVESVRAAEHLGDLLSLRGYTGLVTWTENDPQAERIPASIWAGFGLVLAPGGERVLVGSGADELRRWFQQQNAACYMPGPDRFERTLDGLVVEEASRSGAGLIWSPGSGVNELEKSADPLQVVTARVDEGTESVAELAAWARGDRGARRRARVAKVTEVPRRILRGVTGWRSQY